jgi:hypothetical protein
VSSISVEGSGRMVVVSENEVHMLITLVQLKETLPRVVALEGDFVSPHRAVLSCML